MVNKLTEWIKSVEAQGYSENQLRDYLIQQGYNSNDIDESITSFGKKQTTNSFSIKDIFKPTILKCFFPILLLILIFISFFINSTNIPPIGEHYCDLINKTLEKNELNEEIKIKSFENNVDPQELINLYQEEENFKKQSYLFMNPLHKHLINLLKGNLYFTTSRVYKLNPFFPIPCEASRFDEFTDSDFCKYYISEENYNCISNYVEKNNMGSGSNMGLALFGHDLTPYKKISFIELLIHSIILILILYLIISLISFGRLKLSKQKNKNKIKINIFLIIIPILSLFIFEKIEILFLFPLIIVFIISSFIKNEKKNKIFLYIMIVISILLMINGIFVINFIINEDFGSNNSYTYKETEYKILSCENTKILSMEEKQQLRINETYINEEWNVCDNPNCYDICTDYSNQKQSNNKKSQFLRGDNPSCICGS